MTNFKITSIEKINELKNYKNFGKLIQRINIILSAKFSYNLKINVLTIINDNEICSYIIYYKKNKKIFNFKNTFFYKNALLKKQMINYLLSNNFNYSLTIFDQLDSKTKDESNIINIKLKIKDDINKQWDLIPSKTKNMIRKAKKLKVNIIQNNKNLKDFYKIYYYNMLKKKILPHTYDFFLNLFQQYDDKIYLFTSLDEKKVTGGIILIFEKDHAYYPFHSSLTNYNKNSINDMLIWEIIQFSQNKGISYIDFGEATINSGVYKFKKNFSKNNIMSYLYKHHFNNNRKFIYIIKDYFLSKKLFFILYLIKFPIRYLLKVYKINNLGI